MNTITLYGASDDLIEIEGDIREEWSAADHGNDVIFSDGTIASIYYSGAGIWRINIIRQGSALYTLKSAIEADGDDYSDRLTLTGDVQWAIVGVMAKAKGAKP